VGAVTDAIGSLDVAWAVADRPRSGESVSGDRHLVQRRGEQVLAVVVDGLGHGTHTVEDGGLGHGQGVEDLLLDGLGDVGDRHVANYI